jgi:branched-chain amino acid transport system ATP-binding protein
MAIRDITPDSIPMKGVNRFLGQDITGMEAEDIAGIGIACIPDGRRIFPGLAVIDNLMPGATPRKRTSRDDIQKNIDRVFGILPQLEEFKGRLGWQLSGGHFQMLADPATNLLANEEMKAHYLGAHAHVKEARQRRRV